MFLLRLTLKNIAARKFLFLGTALSVVLGVAFVVGVFIVTDSLRATFDDIADDIAGSIDLRVRTEIEFGDRLNAPEVDPALVDEIAGVDGVEAVTGGVAAWNVVIIDEAGEPLQSVGPPQLGVSWSGEEALSELFLAEGRPPAGPDEFATNRRNRRVRRSPNRRDVPRQPAGGHARLRTRGHGQLGRPDRGPVAGRAVQRLRSGHRHGTAERRRGLGRDPRGRGPGGRHRRRRRRPPPGAAGGTRGADHRGGGRGAGRRVRHVHHDLPEHPAGVRGHHPRGVGVPGEQRVLHRHRPAHPRVGPAAGRRRHRHPDPALGARRGGHRRPSRHGARPRRRHRRVRGAEGHLRRPRRRAAHRSAAADGAHGRRGLRRRCGHHRAGRALAGAQGPADHARRSPAGGCPALQPGCRPAPAGRRFGPDRRRGAAGAGPRGPRLAGAHPAGAAGRHPRKLGRQADRLVGGEAGGGRRRVGAAPHHRLRGSRHPRICWWPSRSVC